MAHVSIHDKKVWVDSTPIPLISGEIHLWRLAPQAWPGVLQRVKEMGLQVVSSYICWDFHEISPGNFDFHGHTDPRRNLPAMLDAFSQAGFWIIIRPGPYVYAEWLNAGVPDRVASFHRLEPEFLQAARQYMEAVTPILQPYFATHGGRIILFQADNELDAWHPWYTEKLGLGQKPGVFQEFLKERYSTLEQLNSTWGSTFTDFAEARAVLALPPGRSEYLPRYLDFCRFKHWFVFKAARWTVQTYRELGVDLPIYLNGYSTVSVQPWSELEQVGDLFGPDLYPSNEFKNSPDEHRQFLDSIRYTRTFSRLPFIPEFESGIWHGWHYDNGILTANQYRLLGFSALLAGAAGWNWYMLVNRDNWYMCPINEKGKIRPELFRSFQQVIQVYRELDPTKARKITNLAVTFDTLQQQALPIAGADLLRALYKADIDYEFYDLKLGQVTKPLVLYAGGEWLSAAGQEQLWQYVHSGGHLVFLGMFPRWDEQGNSMNRFEVPDPAGVVGEIPDNLKLEVELPCCHVTVKTPWMLHFDGVTGEPIFAVRRRSEASTQEEMDLIQNLPDGDRYVVGYTQPLGRGRLTYLGLMPSPELVAALHPYAGLSIPTQSQTSGVSTTLFVREGVYYLVVVNLGIETRAVQITLAPEFFIAGTYNVQDLVTGKTWQVDREELLRLAVTLPRKDATVLKITPVIDL